MDATVVLDQQGGLVIPAGMRQALGIGPGDRLRLRVEGGRVVIERRLDAVAGLKAVGERIPGGPSLVAELLAERRSEAVRDGR